MARIAFLLADGFETIEVLTPLDILRRGEQDVSLVSCKDRLRVTTAQRVTLACDDLLTSYNFDTCDMIVLPGGGDGVKRLRANERVCELVQTFMRSKSVGAICAAPSILAELGLLEGRHATCYPGWDTAFPAGVRPDELGVIRDGNLITGSGPAYALPFGLALLDALAGKDVRDRVAHDMLVSV